MMGHKNLYKTNGNGGFSPVTREDVQNARRGNGSVFRKVPGHDPMVGNEYAPPQFIPVKKGKSPRGMPPWALGSTENRLLRVMLGFDDCE